MEATSRQVHALARRTVHIKMYPTARTFAERREVLRVLEQFGEVTMFRSLKYFPKTPIPNAFLALFADESAAIAAQNSSALRYRLITTPGPPPLTPSQEIEATVAPLDPADPANAPPPQEPPTEKVFELHISSTNYDHHKHITSPSTNPLYGPFTPVAPNRSFIASSLNQIIQPSLWAPGLRDWETDGSNLRDEVEKDRSSIGGSIEWRVNQRERKRKEKNSWIMKGLQPLQKQREAKKSENAPQNKAGTDASSASP